MTLDAKGQALDLAVIGNCRTAALVDAGGRIVWWCFPRFDSDPAFSRLLAGSEEKGFCDVTLEGHTTSRGGLSAQHRDRGDNHSRRFGQRRTDHRLYPALQTLRAHLQPPPALSPDRADCRSAAHQDQGSSHLQLWPAVRQPGDGLQPYSLRRRRRNIAPDDRRAALLHRAGDVVRADQARHADPRSRRTIRGRRRVDLARVSGAHAGLLDRLGAVAGRAAGIPGRRHSRRHHAQALQLRGDGRHHRRPYDIHPRGARHVSATGTTASAGSAMRSSSSRRSIAWAPPRRWRTTSTTSPISPCDAERPLRPVYGIVPDRAARGVACTRSGGLPGHGSRARRQPGRRADAARCLRQRHSRRLADVHRRAPAAHGRCCAIPPPRAARRAGRGASPSSPTPARGNTVAASASTRTPPPCAGWRAIAWPASRSALGLASRAAHWREQADALRNEILARAWNERRGAIAGALDHDDLDASVLLLPELGILPAIDERFVRTCDVIGKELNRNGFIMRYTSEDDFGLPETAFLVCQFWYIDALAATRPQGGGAGDVCRPSGAQKSVRPAFRGHPSGDGPALGQPAADLLDGGHRQHGPHPVAQLAGGLGTIGNAEPCSITARERAAVRR